MRSEAKNLPLFFSQFLVFMDLGVFGIRVIVLLGVLFWLFRHLRISTCALRRVTLHTFAPFIF